MINKVIEIARKAEEMNPRQIKKKVLFNLTVIVIAIAVTVIDLWVIAQGWVNTEPGRKLVAFVALVAAILFVVGVMSMITLLLGMFAYQRLSLLVERAEKEEVVEEEEALIRVFSGALQEPALVGSELRDVFANALRRAPALEEHPGLREVVEQRILVN